jgi:hypothetical protein
MQRRLRGGLRHLGRLTQLRTLLLGACYRLPGQEAQHLAPLAGLTCLDVSGTAVRRRLQHRARAACPVALPCMALCGRQTIHCLPAACLPTPYLRWATAPKASSPWRR